jgi:HAD superfamily hydrolase (TIGR01549 family)
MPERSAIIFDVEGTLIDCVPQAIACWKETLESFGFSVSAADLHAYSGCDGRIMLEGLLPLDAEARMSEILQAQEQLYAAKYLSTTVPFEPVKELFQELRRRGHLLALATTCKEKELDHYDKLLGVIDECAAIACGSQVKRGKPHPDLFLSAMKGLGVRTGFAIGDTPYDAEAGSAAGLRTIGVLRADFQKPSSRLLDVYKSLKT